MRALHLIAMDVIAISTTAKGERMEKEKKSRIYVVDVRNDAGEVQSQRLVDARSQDAAERFCAGVPKYSATVAKSSDVAKLMNAGCKVEDATA